ncbi:prolyl oligopeptidase family serine peptidase [Mycetocola zhujimingii]|uniref:S9 family peptidase n=1 Tax=Mycetocola zhujimingii TaxID=2079792 RepID=A0A2U1TBI8_9MICO|nr:prolyl oligopeptidase family serine peptidase [Mycetocola zhujimingii]PWC06265.1 S9 family peptidase [Mycetocola zhujimingii]
MTTIAPYGSWRSPISAHDLAESGHAVSEGTWVGNDVWWLELRPSEGGRFAVRTTGDNGDPIDVLPEPWNARTRVHEYGGGAWAADDDGTLVFAEFTDQRLYRLDRGSRSPVPLTSADSGFRFADLTWRDGEIIAVRETHSGDLVERDIVAVPVDGTADGNNKAIRSIVSGSHFLAYPRFSPDGTRLAWVAWDHPQMPWDGTELRVGDLDRAGQVGEWRTLAGSPTESLLQPEWRDDDHLTIITDRSGWWNLAEVDLQGEVTPLHPDEAEYGDALWFVGLAWYRLLADGRILASRTLGQSELVIIDPATGASSVVAQPLTHIVLGPVRGTSVLLAGGSAKDAPGLRRLDLESGEITVVRLSVDSLPDAGYLPVAESRTFTGDREVHAIVYPPRNADFAAPDDELPPFVAFVHGGPTTRAPFVVNPAIAYFTSRGIGVVDVNYGGSTGYGREYRERLRGQWGIVDVEDTVATVLGLADAGLADRDRLGIRGGSAGGWTVLAALTSSDVFAAGTSYFGVAELTQFARDTHDFESRYLDGLIGPLPEAADLYQSRAPLNRVDNLSTPVLLLQGLDDPIVPPSQAELFRDALARKGIPHAYIAFEGESHGFRRASTIVSATEAELSFYGQVMGFDPVGVPALELVSE